MRRSVEMQSADGSDRGFGFTRWVFVEGDRVIVSAVLLLGLFVGLSGGAIAGVTSVRSTDPLFYLFSAFLGGNFTLIAIVISINQLVLSRQLDTPGGLRTQFQNMAEFRQAAASATDSAVMPILPPAFMYELVDGLAQDSDTLTDSISEVSDDELRTELRSLADGLRAEVTDIAALIDESGTSPFHALAVTLDMNLGLRMQQVQHLQSKPPLTLPEETREALDGLVERLELLDVSRGYFKTLFMQMQLSKLTRFLLYVGIPAEIAATVALLSLGAAPESMLRWWHLFPVVPAMVTLCFAPLVILLAFVLRITLVTERTVAITPFSTPEQVS